MKWLFDFHLGGYGRTLYQLPRLHLIEVIIQEGASNTTISLVTVMHGEDLRRVTARASKVYASLDGVTGHGISNEGATKALREQQQSPKLKVKFLTQATHSSLL